MRSDGGGRHSLVRIVLGAITAGGLLGLAPVVASGALATSSPTTQLADDVLAGLTGLPSSPTAADTPMQVGVMIRGGGQAALDAAYQAIYTPGSPQYHRFLTAEQVAGQFGAPATTESNVASWATRDGLQTVLVSPNNEYVLLAGTADQVEQTFSVTLQDFTANGTTFYANTQGPTVPTDVSAVLGLNSLLRSRTFDHAPAATAPHGTPAQSTCLPALCIGLTTPEDLWSIYGQPTNLSNPAADFGQGQQMAVLGEGAVAGTIADLRLFEKEFNLPQIPMTINSVGDDFKDTSGNVEWNIDTQASTGMAPKAAGETLYFAKDLSDSSVLADFQAWSADPHGPMQANASFGECEEDPTSTPGFNNTPTGGVLAGSAGVAFTQGSERALEEAALQGKTLFSSTGDTGSSCPLVIVNVNGVANEAFPETNYPASSRYAVAVGGTVLYGGANTASAPASNAPRVQETAWTFTGGGNSFYIPEPSYQQGIALLDHQDCIAQPNGTPYSSPTPCRGIPDVAAQSGDVVSNGYAITAGGTPDSAGGGTSLSSPLWVGMWTRVQAVAKPSPNGRYTLGFANETLYPIGKDPTKDAASFFDIGNGTLSSPVTANGYYTSLPRTPLDPSGWDYVSGLGAPNVSNLAVAATGNTALVPTRNVTAPPPTDCGQPGLSACGGAACTAGAPLWTNPSHTATDPLGNQDPQLSLLAGNMALSADGSTLIVTLTVENLSAAVPTGATGASWYGLWQYNGTTYFASAEVGIDGVVNYGDGTYSSSGGYSQGNTDTGTFTTGPNGTVVIEVPLKNVGAPPVGATLSSTAGKTYVEEGVPPTPAGGSSGAQLAVDSGGPGCSFTA